MKRCRRGIPAIIMAMLLAGCWLLCAAETEATHEDVDTQPCVTCCLNHQLIPPSTGSVISLPHELVTSKTLCTSSLYSQTVVRLLDRPPKFSA